MGIPATRNITGKRTGCMDKCFAAGCVTAPERKFWEEQDDNNGAKKVYLGIRCGRAVVNLEESQRLKGEQYEKAKLVSALLDEIEKSLKPFAAARFFNVGNDLFVTMMQHSYKIKVLPSGEVLFGVYQLNEDIRREQMDFKDVVHRCLCECCPFVGVYGSFVYQYGTYTLMFKNGYVVDDLGVVYWLDDATLPWVAKSVLDMPDALFVPCRKFAYLSKQDLYELGEQCSPDEFQEIMYSIWGKECAGYCEMFGVDWRGDNRVEDDE